MLHTLRRFIILALATLAWGIPTPAADDAPKVQETVVSGPNRVTLKVRMEGPYTADVPLQVVCYFKYTKDGAKKMTGAPVELDKHLGGVIASLRERGEFTGDELETCLIAPKEGSIKAKALLLVGLGDEAKFSLETMGRVGKVALREAVRLGVTKVAFAPLIRDQGNSTLKTGDVEKAVVNGMLLAYDTERRLQTQGLAKAYTLEEWWIEAGPAYFDETVAGTRTAVKESEAAIAARPSTRYASGSK